MDDMDDFEEFASSATKWAQDRNDAWLADKGTDARYYVNHHEDKIYFYKKVDDYPDRPYVWYSFQSIGTWSPRSNSFMWACANKTSVGARSDISEKAMSWFSKNLGIRENVILAGTSLDNAIRVAAVAARLAGAVAMYKAPCYVRDVENELRAAGQKVTMLNRNDLYLYEFLAITSFKNVVA